MRESNDSDLKRLLEQCIEEGILADFFREHFDEVLDMKELLFKEYDAKREEKEKLEAQKELELANQENITIKQENETIKKENEILKENLMKVGFTQQQIEEMLKRD